MQIHKFRKIFILLTNDSTDSNHSLTFTVLVVAVFTKEEERKRQKQKQQARQVNNILRSNYLDSFILTAMLIYKYRLQLV